MGDFWSVEQGQALNPGDCPWVAFSAPLGVVAPDDVPIDYSRGSRNAMVHVPVVQSSGLPTVVGDLMSAVGWGKRRKSVGPTGTGHLSETLVRIRVSSKDRESSYEVEWKENIGPLALQVLQTDPGVAKAIVAGFSTRPRDQAKVESLTPEELRKRVPAEAWERLPKGALAGSYVLITPTSADAMAAFNVPTGKNTGIGTPVTIIMSPDGGKVRFVWRYLTFVGGPK